jgi:drug/metabolite transporter superfamily protein YnfA
VSRTYAGVLLAFTAVAIVAELLTLVFSDRIVDLIGADDGELKELGRLHVVLAVLSLFYIVDIALLLFSGDRVFQAYGTVFVGLSVLLVLVRKWVTKMRFLVKIESAVCLAMLLDVARTVVGIYRG